MEKQQIMVAFADEGRPLGSFWQITAKKPISTSRPTGCRGSPPFGTRPNDANPGGHRFHVRLDRGALARAVQNQHFVAHGIPPGGQLFDGHEIEDGVFHVARIRWLPELAAPEYRAAAWNLNPLPELGRNRQGVVHSAADLGPAEAADVDLVVSYREPFWLAGERFLRDNSRLGPLRNDSGMCLTAVAFHRQLGDSPTPADLAPPLPGSADDACRNLSAGPVREGNGDIYWFIEKITSRQMLRTWQTSGEQPWVA